MPRISGSYIFVLLHAALFCIPATVRAQSLQTAGPPPMTQTIPASQEWTAQQVEHIDGLPDMKPHKKGTLTLDGEALTFTGKNGNSAIPRKSITAVSVGNQRVEMWGTTGRILRMVIPDNGGLAVAAVAHHRIDILTVEYSDAHGGSHSAVFFLGANQAAKAIESFAVGAKAASAPRLLDCQNAATEPGSMFIAAPDWKGAQVPAVYQALVYEHLMERFRKARDMNNVYREGEKMPEGLCPRYTMHLSVTGFKEGSSVKRAMLGPVGMFVGTTQMIFHAELSDRTGVIDIKEEVKTTVRGESESTNVADHVAKTLVKKYEKALREAEKKSQKQAEVPHA